MRRIIAAYTINSVGTWFGLVALSLGVFDQTHSALAVAATLAAGRVVPAFAVPAVVARVEASNHRRELTGLYVFEAAATALLAVFLAHFSLPIVLLLVALDGTAALAASALLRAEVARTARAEAGERDTTTDSDVEHEAYAEAAERRANAALNVAFSAAFVVGPVVGGVVVAGAGVTTALLLDAASFLICGALVLDLHPHVEEAAGDSVRSRLRAAWSFVNDVPALRALLLVQAVALVFFESAEPIQVSFSKVTLDAGDRGFGLLVAMWGVGVAVGSVVFARSPNRELRTMISGGTFAVGLAYIGFAAAPSLLVACGAAVVGGFGNGIQWAPLISAVQLLTPPHLHGRVMGALESIGALAPALGLALGGALVVLTSPRTAFLVVGVGAALTTVGFVRIPINQSVATRPPSSDTTVEASDVPLEQPASTT